MIPKKIQFRESPAEVRLFEMFRTHLPAAFTVLHHVPYRLADPRRRTTEGEADFVVVHPQLGALVIEVKGGELRYNADSNLWYQTSIGRDDEHPIKNPFAQAADGARGIVEFLKGYPGWDRKWGPIGSGVCFPNVAFDCEPLPGAQRHFVIDGVALADPEGLQRRVEDIMQWHLNNEHRQGERGARKLIEALNHDLVIRQPLGLAAADTERAIAELSPQQYRIVRLLRKRLRMAISGPAGSGKTLLALERARDLARSGARTLILCYNRPLADFLRAEVEKEENLEVLTCHQLCERLLRKTSLRSPSGDEFYRKAPELTLDALAQIDDRYDAVIVDEGQVIDAEWWIPIEELLSDRTAGVLWVFYDDNQALYGQPQGLPEGLDHVPLLEVWRNSKPIFESVMRFYRGDPVECLGPDGPDVEIRETNGDLRKEIGRVLHRLVHREHVSAADIVVLTARNAESSSVSGDIGSFRLTESPSQVMTFVCQVSIGFSGWKHLPSCSARCGQGPIRSMKN
jgi:hypothetical protein